MADPFPKPVGPLAYLRILSPTAGGMSRFLPYTLSNPSVVKVSPLALGTWSLGDKWSAFTGGGANQDEAFKYLDVYRDAGGNFVDTA